MWGVALEEPEKPMENTARLETVVEKYWEAILGDWLDEQLSASGVRKELLSREELRSQSKEFLLLFQEAAAPGDLDISRERWQKVRDFLSDLSRTRGEKGFSPSETATFVFSLKNPVLNRLRQVIGNNTDGLFTEIARAAELIDRLGLLTFEVYQKSREEVIRRQQDEMLELSTPVVKLWKGILALPMIGTLDSNRTQTVLEALLQKIVETEAEIAIIDITGVPTVDTLVAQHLMKTVTAARLMGAECIISGIRPQIAQTIVHLGVDLGDIVTKSSLADALSVALQRRGLKITASTPKLNQERTV
jgi:rsbT co-antagonist protein RsbR